VTSQVCPRELNNNGIACEGTVAAAQTVSYSSSSSSSSGNSGSRGQQVVNAAMQWLGTTYAWGGGDYNGPTLGIRDGGVADRYGDYRKTGFDCSGLVMYVFAQVGVSLPHSSYAQYGMGSPVSRDQLQPGDLVFFDGLGHVGIYVGGGSFIHAPHTGDVVKISSISGWYASTYVGARRI